MAFVQSTYSENIAIAVAGMLADADHSVDTRVCETAAGIGFGVACGQGTANNGVRLGAAAATGFVGISVRDKTLVNSEGDEYQQYNNVGVMTRGDIWVTVGADVVAGNDVTFVASTGVLSTATASGSQFTIAGARWMTSATAGKLALLRLSGALPTT